MTDYTKQKKELIQSMSAFELRMNARKGEIDAIAELKRRNNIVARTILPQPEIDIGV